MKKDKSGQSAGFRKNFKNLIELYRSFNPLVPITKEVKSALRFFATPYSIENRSE